MLNDVDLVVEDERIQYREGRIVEDAREHHVFQILKAVGVMDPLSNVCVLDADNLFELCLVGEIVTMIRLVAGEVWIIYRQPDVSLVILLGTRGLKAYTRERQPRRG